MLALLGPRCSRQSMTARAVVQEHFFRIVFQYALTNAAQAMFRSLSKQGFNFHRLTGETLIYETLPPRRPRGFCVFDQNTQDLAAASVTVIKLL